MGQVFLSSQIVITEVFKDRLIFLDRLASD